MQVVDTNVLVSLLMEGPYSTSARALRARDSDWQSEPLLLIDLTDEARADGAGDDEKTGVVPGDTEVRRGVENVGVRDAAHVTEDAKLRRAAPDLTCSLAAARTD